MFKEYWEMFLGRKKQKSEDSRLRIQQKIIVQIYLKRLEFCWEIHETGKAPKIKGFGKQRELQGV